MVSIEITKLSSKGQIVIPASIREKYNEGDTFVVIEDEGRIILKKSEDFKEALKEDLEFAKRTEEAYKRIENGESIKVDSENLVEEMMKW